MQEAGRKPMSEQVSTNVSYTAAGGTFVLGALSPSEWAMLIGVLTALATFGLNYVMQVRRDRREQREHEARMSQFEKTAGAE